MFRLHFIINDFSDFGTDIEGFGKFPLGGEAFAGKNTPLSDHREKMIPHLLFQGLFFFHHESLIPRLT